MKIYGKALLVSLGIAASTLVSIAPASAQYYGRGYERSDRYGRGNLQAQKQAIRAQREAQRRAMRGGYGRGGVYGRGGAYGQTGAYGDGRLGTHGPTGGMIAVPGPYGSYAVPVQPGNNNGNN